jgi:hypothetical protein
MAKSILLSLLVLTCACGISRAGPSSPDWETWQKVLANPISEAKAALERGDHRLMAVQGHSIEMPGVNMDMFKAAKRFGIVMIDSRGDAAPGPEHSYFLERAEEFATLYNRYILEHSPPSDPL